MLHRILLFMIAILVFNSIYGQANCRFFNEYKNEIKIWATPTIDSLKRLGIDTIIFYGVGVPNTGRIAYGKITWTNKGTVNMLEIKTRYQRNDNKFHLTTPKYDSTADFSPFQFYNDYRLDTVTTNPKELTWMSHDYLHFVYSSIHGTEVCFTAEEYLLRDYEHLRSRWIKKLNKDANLYELCR